MLGGGYILFLQVEDIFGGGGAVMELVCNFFSLANVLSFFSGGLSLIFFQAGVLVMWTKCWII